MDIPAELLREHSRKQTDRIARWIQRNPHGVAALSDAYFSGPPKLRDRAAWVFSALMDHRPRLLGVYMRRFANVLEAPGASAAVRRETMKIFERLSIPSSLTGQMFDVALHAAGNPDESTAVRCSAISVVRKLVRLEPALIGEVHTVLRSLPPGQPPAILSRLRREFPDLAPCHGQFPDPD